MESDNKQWSFTRPTTQSASAIDQKPAKES